MMKWFRSSNGVVLLSFLALISLLFRSYVDTAYILPEDYSGLGNNFAIWWFFGYTAVIGGWIWALVATGKDSRGGMITLLVYSIVLALVFGAVSLLIFVSYPIEIVIYGSNFLFGSIAFFSVFSRMRGLIENGSNRPMNPPKISV
jgi:heme/copper-type cytochrome/quinol oxidase subunit 3